MKRHHLGGALLAGTLLAALAVLLALQGGPRRGVAASENSQEISTQAGAAAATAPGTAADRSTAGKPSFAARLDGTALRSVRTPASTAAPTASLPAVQADASSSLAAALRDGDARSPPLLRATPAQPASAAELADPAAYRRYESRQQARLYRAFEQEAVIALGDMQRDLQRGRDAQLPPEQLAEGEEKARKLAETLRRLQDGELQPQP